MGDSLYLGKSTCVLFDNSTSIFRIHVNHRFKSKINQYKRVTHFRIKYICRYWIWIVCVCFDLCTCLLQRNHIQDCCWKLKQIFWIRKQNNNILILKRRWWIYNYEKCQLSFGIGMKAKILCIKIYASHFTSWNKYFNRIIMQWNVIKSRNWWFFSVKLMCFYWFLSKQLSKRCFMNPFIL